MSDFSSSLKLTEFLVEIKSLNKNVQYIESSIQILQSFTKKYSNLQKLIEQIIQKIDIKAFPNEQINFNSFDLLNSTLSQKQSSIDSSKIIEQIVDSNQKSNTDQNNKKLGQPLIEYDLNEALQTYYKNQDAKHQTRGEQNKQNQKTPDSNFKQKSQKIYFIGGNKFQNQSKSLDKQSLLQNSSIINTQQNLNKLIKLFDRKIKGLKVLFKASEHNFSMSKYYQTCGQQTNTIIICLNDRQKILGGYSRLHFSPQINPKIEKDSYIQDSSCQSFVFSLTNEQKFVLKNIKRAIYRQKNKHHINFGYFFYICDKANVSNSVLSVSCPHYGCNNYDYIDDTKSNLRLIGNANHLFTIKEWEVIKVQF